MNQFVTLFFLSSDDVLTLTIDEEVVFAFHEPEPFPINYFGLGIIHEPRAIFYFNCTPDSSPYGSLTHRTDIYALDLPQPVYLTGVSNSLSSALTSVIALIVFQFGIAYRNALTQSN